MTSIIHASRTAAMSWARALLWSAALIGLLSCGGGGGAGGDHEPRPEGVYAGFEPQVPGLTLEQALNWEFESTGGDGSGGTPAVRVSNAGVAAFIGNAFGTRLRPAFGLRV